MPAPSPALPPAGVEPQLGGFPELGDRPHAGGAAPPLDPRAPTTGARRGELEPAGDAGKRRFGFGLAPRWATATPRN